MVETVEVYKGWTITSVRHARVTRRTIKPPPTTQFLARKEGAQSWFVNVIGVNPQDLDNGLTKLKADLDRQ